VTRARLLSACAMVAAAAGCGVEEEPVGLRRQPLTAYCTATVGTMEGVPVETDYLPHVVNCENGGAAFEALEAQAIAARSYLYYKLDRSGSIGDGTGDQVYSCDREPTEDHYRAVEETSGIVLRYMDVQIAAFYVAGAKQDPPDCRGGTDDPTDTERYVTYNEGREGDGIEQTTLGWVDPGNHANRGCLSQNGSHCLAGLGWSYRDILRFYYGEDIEMDRAEGECIVDPQPDAGIVPEPDGGTAHDGGRIPADGGPPPDAADPDRIPGEGVSGSCAIAARGGGSPWALPIALVLLVGHRWRRRA